MNTTATYKFLTVETDDGETYYLVNRKSGECIGAVAKYRPWSQWCFFPNNETVWSDGCLADVQDFMGKVKRGEVTT